MFPVLVVRSWFSNRFVYSVGFGELRPVSDLDFVLADLAVLMEDGLGEDVVVSRFAAALDERL